MMDKGLLQKQGSEADQSEAYEAIELEYENLRLLEASKSLMSNFIHELASLQNTPVLQWISKHTGKLKFDDLNSQNIKRLTEKRVDKMIKNKKIKRNWGNQDSKILVWVVSKFCQLNKISRLDDMASINWEFISSVIPGAIPRDCLFKWLTFKKTKLSDCQWDDEESQILRKLVEQFGEDQWKEVSLCLYEQNKNKKKKFRNPKQCRQHWLSFLNPKKKTGLWQKEEDIKLLSSVIEKKGEKKWAEIRKHFCGRTQNAIKNRYNLLIQKQKKSSEEKDQLALVYQYLKELGVKNIKKYKEMIKQKSTRPEDDVIESEVSGSYEMSSMIGKGLDEQSSKQKISEKTAAKKLLRSPFTIINADFENILRFVKSCGYDQELLPALIDQKMNIQILKKEQI